MSRVVFVLVLTDHEGDQSSSVHARPEGLAATLEQEWFERAEGFYRQEEAKIASDRAFLARAEFAARMTWLRGQFQERGEKVYIDSVPFDQSQGGAV